MLLEYIIKGCAHFFNLFFDYFDYITQNTYLFILVVLIAICLIMYKTVKEDIVSLIKTFLGLFKYFIVDFSIVLNIIQFIIIFNCNNDVNNFTIVVAVIEFCIQCFETLNNSTQILSNERIISSKSIKNIMKGNLLIIATKIISILEEYSFDINSMKIYTIWMGIAIVVQLLNYIITNSLFIYEELNIRRKIKFKNYKSILFFIDYVKAIIISKNDMKIMVLFQKYLIVNNDTNNIDRSEIIKMLKLFKIFYDKEEKNKNIKYLEYMEWFNVTCNQLEKIKKENYDNEEVPIN